LNKETGHGKTQRNLLLVFAQVANDCVSGNMKE